MLLWSLSGRIYLGKKQQLKQPVVWAEYDLAVRFPIIFSVVSVSALLALLHALRRAAEGYENEHGFYIRTPSKHVDPPRGVLATSGSRI